MRDDECSKLLKHWNRRIAAGKVAFQFRAVSQDHLKGEGPARSYTGDDWAADFAIVGWDQVTVFAVTG